MMDDIPAEFRSLFEPSPVTQQKPKRLKRHQREAKFILENRGCFKPPEQTVPAVETHTESLDEELNPQ